MQIDQEINAIIEPAEVSYWPLQPGWYVLFGILLLIVLFLLRKRYKLWLSQAYKREAIEKINSLSNDFNFFFHLFLGCA